MFFSLYVFGSYCAGIDDYRCPKRAAAISEHQYGLFFEEINHAGDGGLYAELIRNRSFEDHNTTPEYWSAIQQNGQNVKLSLNKKQVMNKAQQTCLQLTVSGASATHKAGVCNTGFWGMHFVTDSTYTLRVWVKASTDFNGKYTDNSSRMMELQFQRKCSWKAL